MKIIGLTGGIGSGKSTASQYLSQQGCYIIDADKISRKMTEPGNPCLEEIRKNFGQEYFDENGNLLRQKLGKNIFGYPEKKRLLESIITNKVIEKILIELEALRQSDFDGVIVVDAPLLFECEMQKYVDETWLIFTDIKTQVDRIIQRDGLDEEDILLRINHQMSTDEKKKIADKLIDNSGSLKELFRQIDDLLA